MDEKHYYINNHSYLSRIVDEDSVVRERRSRGCFFVVAIVVLDSLTPEGLVGTERSRASQSVVAGTADRVPRTNGRKKWAQVIEGNAFH